jgi:hypothetical protein
MRLALAIVIAFAGCKPETARKADRAAADVVEQRADLKQAAESENPAAVVVEAEELSAAERLFTERKRIRIAALRGEHSVIGTQVMLISTLAEYSQLTDAGRADINNTLTTFHRRLDEAGNQIEGLDRTGAVDFSQRDDAVREAMSLLEAARKAAWRALHDAPRIDPNAS